MIDHISLISPRLGSLWGAIELLRMQLYAKIRFYDAQIKEIVLCK